MNGIQHWPKPQPGIACHAAGRCRQQAPEQTIRQIDSTLDPRPCHWCCGHGRLRLRRDRPRQLIEYRSSSSLLRPRANTLRSQVHRCCDYASRRVSLQVFLATGCNLSAKRCASRATGLWQTRIPMQSGRQSLVVIKGTGIRGDDMSVDRRVNDTPTRLTLSGTVFASKTTP